MDNLNLTVTPEQREKLKRLGAVEDDEVVDNTPKAFSPSSKVANPSFTESLGASTRQADFIGAVGSKVYDAIDGKSKEEIARRDATDEEILANTGFATSAITMIASPTLLVTGGLAGAAIKGATGVARVAKGAAAYSAAEVVNQTGLMAAGKEVTFEDVATHAAFGAIGGGLFEAGGIAWNTYRKGLAAKGLTPATKFTQDVNALSITPDNLNVTSTHPMMIVDDIVNNSHPINPNPIVEDAMVGIGANAANPVDVGVSNGMGLASKAVRGVNAYENSWLNPFKLLGGRKGMSQQARIDTNEFMSGKETMAKLLTNDQVTNDVRAGFGNASSLESYNRTLRNELHTKINNVDEDGYLEVFTKEIAALSDDELSAMLTRVGLTETEAKAQAVTFKHLASDSSTSGMVKGGLEQVGIGSGSDASNTLRTYLSEMSVVVSKTGNKTGLRSVDEMSGTYSKMYADLEARQVGAHILEPSGKGNYRPQRWDQTRLLTERESFVKLVTPHVRIKANDGRTSRQAAEDLHKTLTSSTSISNRVSSGGYNPSKPLTIDNLPPSVINKFTKTNERELIEEYVNRIANRLGIAEHFNTKALGIDDLSAMKKLEREYERAKDAAIELHYGTPNGEQKLQEIIADLKVQLEMDRASVRNSSSSMATILKDDLIKMDEELQSKILEARATITNPAELEKRLLKITNDYKEFKNSLIPSAWTAVTDGFKMSEFGTSLRLYGNSFRLPNVLLSMVPDFAPHKLMSSVGAQKTLLLGMESAKDMLTRNGFQRGAMANRKAVGERLGIIQQSYQAKTSVDSMFALGASQLNPTNKMGKYAQWQMDKVWKMSGAAHHDAMNKSVFGDDFIRMTVDNVKGKGALRPDELDRINASGFGLNNNSPRMQSIREQLAKHATDEDGFTNPNLDGWDDKVAATTYNSFIQRYVHSLSTTPIIAHLPQYAAENEIGRTVITFMSYMWTHIGTQFKVRLAGGNLDLAAYYAKYAAFTAAGAYLWAEFTAGDDESDEEIYQRAKNRTINDLIILPMTNAVVIARFFPNTATDIKAKILGEENVYRSTSGKSQVPVLGVIGDIDKFASEVMSGNITGDTISQGAHITAPFLYTPLMKPFVDYLADGTANLAGLPEEKEKQ